MCLDRKTIAATNSFYFVGFGFGIIFLTLPDSIGRKGTMGVMMPMFIVAAYITIFSRSLKWKSVGYFL